MAHEAAYEKTRLNHSARRRDSGQPLAVRRSISTSKDSTIGFVWIGSPGNDSTLAGLRQGLADRGYVPGHNLLIDARYAAGDQERIPTLIAELLALGVDILVTPGTPISLAAHKRRRQFRSSASPAIRSASVSRPASPIRAATSPACLCCRASTVRSGSSCSRRPCRSSIGSRSCGTPTMPRRKMKCVGWTRRRGALASRYSISRAAARTRIKLGRHRRRKLRRLDRERRPFDRAADLPHCRPCREQPRADDLRFQRRGSSRGPDVLFRRLLRALASGCGLCRSHSQRSKARRPSNEQATAISFAVNL